MGFSRQEYWSGLPFPSPLAVAIFNDIYEYYICKSELTIILITGKKPALQLKCNLSNHKNKNLII